MFGEVERREGGGRGRDNADSRFVFDPRFFFSGQAESQARLGSSKGDLGYDDGVGFGI